MGKSSTGRDAASRVKGISYGIFLLLFLLVSANAFAVTKTSVASGNWGDSATWSPSGVPTSSDDVIIDGGHNIVVNISNAACLSLQIGDNTKANATVTFNNGSQLTVTGTVVFGGSGNALRNGAVDMTFGGRLICSGFTVSNFSSFTPGTGTVEFTGSSTLPPEITNFNNLAVNGSGITVTLGSTLVVTGDLSLTSGTLAASAYLSIGSNASITRSGGAITGTLQGTNNYDVNYTGDSKTVGPERSGTGLRHVSVNLNSGQTVTQDANISITNLTITAGTYSTGSYTLSMSGNLAVNGTLAGTGNVTLTGSNTTISGTGSVSNTGIFEVITGNKTIPSGSVLSFTGTIAITGGVTIENSGTVTSTASGGITGSTIGSTWRNNTNASLILVGPLLATGNLVATASPNTITYNSTSGSQNVKSSAYHHLVIDKSGQSASLEGAITVNGNLTISAGTLDVTAGNYSITLKGNFTNNGTFTRQNGTVTLNGTSAQTLNSALTFHHLTMNNSSGVTLSGDITVNGTLTLTSGKITTGGSYKVAVASTGSVSGGSSSSFVYGKLQKNFATGTNVSRTFEVGNGSSYMPVTLTFGSVTNAGDMTVTTTSGDHSQLSSSCISLSGNLNKYWTLTNSGISPLNYTAVFNYSASDLDAGASPSELRVANYVSGWTNQTIASRTSTSTTASGITAAGDFAIGEYNPKISTQPANATVCATSNVTFTVAATGSGLSYQWRRSPNGGVSWNNVSNGGVYSGATTATLTLTGVTGSLDGYLYRCVVSNTGGCSNTDTSSSAMLTIASSFTINTQPADINACLSSPTSFSVTATGAISGYQWQENTGSGWNNLSNTGVYSGVTTATLSISSVSSGMNGYQYQCVISSNCGPSQNSDTATLSTLTAPSISSNPSGVNTCEQTNVNFSVTASGSSITYQWQESSNGTTWSDLSDGGVYSGATSATLTITSIPYLLNGYYYRCTVSGSCTPPAVSNSASVTLSQRPFLTTQPSTVTIQYNTNRNASFTVAAGGAGTLTYQWQESTDGGLNWGDITNGGIYSGATTITLAITNATIGMDNYQYRCNVSGSCSPLTSSNVATLYISFSFSITANTNWSALSPTPTSTSTIEVKNGATLTVDVANAVCATMQLGRKPNPGGGSGTLVFNSGSQLSVLGPGLNVILGDQNQTGSINMTNGGTLACNGFIIASLGGWTPGAGTVEFTGITTIPASFTSFNNLTANSLLLTLGANTTLTGSLAIDSGSTLNTNTYTLAVPGDLTINGTLSGTGAVTLSGTNKQISGIGTVNNTGIFTLSGGAKTIASGSVISFAGTISISGAITVTNNGSITTTASGGITGTVSGSTWVNEANSSLTISGPLLSTGTLTASASGNTVTYASTSAAQTVKGITYHHLTIDKTGQTGTLGGATTVNGTLALEHGTLAAGSNLTMASGSMVQVNAGSMTGSIQGANVYDVKYTNNSKNTSSELSGSGLRHFTVEMVNGESLYLDRNLASTGNITITTGTLDASTSNYSINVKGNFTNNSTFVPRSGTVTFDGTSAQTISSSSGTAAFNNLTLNNSNGISLSSINITTDGTLTLTAGTLAIGTNTLTLNGAVSQGSGAITSSATGTIAYNQSSDGQAVVAMNYGHLTFSNYNKTIPSSGIAGIAGTFTTGTATGHTLTGSTVEFNGSSAQTVPVFTFNNLTLNNSAGASLDGNVTVDGTLTLTSGTLAVGSNTLTLNGGSSVSGGALTFGATGTLNYNQSSDGQAVIGTDHSNLTFSNYNKVLPSSGAVGITGAFTTGSATGHTVTGSTVDFKGSSQGIPAFTFNHLIVSGSGTKTLTGAVTTNGNLTISASTLDLSEDNYALTVKGNFTNSASFNGRSSTVTFNGTSAQTITGPVPTTFYDLVLDNSGGLSLNNAYITVDNTLTLTSGTFSVGNNRLTLNGTAVTGTATNLSTTSGSALVIGGSASNLTLPASVTALRTLVLNNSNGLGLGASLTLTDSLLFQAGKLTLEDYNLTIESAGIIAGHDTTKYVVSKNNMGSGGWLIRNVSNNDVFVAFPVGTSTSFSPAKIKQTTGSTADNFRVRVVNNMYAAGTTGAQLTENMLHRTWLIEEAVNGGSNATINLGWKPAMEGNNLNTDFLAVTHFNGTQWTHSKSFGAYADAEAIRWRAGSGFTSFSPFSVVDGDMAMDIPLDLKIYFEGCYDATAGEMMTALNSGGYLPLTQPYNVSPWNYNGSESVGSIPNANIVDWVLVELRDAASAGQATSGTLYARKAGFVLKDGSIVETDGITPITFSIKPSGNYFVVVHHRNHLAVMSAGAITYPSGEHGYDFTGANSAHGTDAQNELESGVYGMISGMVETSDLEVNGPDLHAAWNNKNNSGGYFLWDCTLDGNVDAADRTMILNNQLKQSQVP